MLDHRLRRWPNIEPTMAQCLVFSGYQALHTYLSLSGNPTPWPPIPRAQSHPLLIVSARPPASLPARLPITVFTLSMLVYKAKRQYVLTCKVSTYCLLVLQGRLYKSSHSKESPKCPAQAVLGQYLQSQ